MTFTKRLREGVRRGEITCSVRFWTHPRVTVGKRYRMDDGEIEVDSITPLGFPDITPELARQSGFLGLMQVIFDCVRDGYNIRRAWAVMLVIALILAAPFALLALFVFLISLAF